MSFRTAFVLLLGTFALLFAPILCRPEVIFPHDNALEIAAHDKTDNKRISNRKFSDESSAFLPELANNLNSRHKAWLTTWNPHVELGRPAFHLSGLSRSYALTNLLSAFTRDPLKLYTALVLLTLGLSSVFSLLFLRSLELHPVACSVAALGLSFASALMYWLTFVMFLSTICWSICVLWLVTEYIRHRTWTLALGLTFACYSLLLTGYPQMTILLALMVGSYTLIRLIQKEASSREKFGSAFRMLGCAVAGGLLALPVYLDLLGMALASARLGAVSDSFFLAVLPPHNGVREMAGSMATIFDWSWLGNAIAPGFPEPFNGLCFTPVFGSLIWLSFLLKPGRELWFWRVFLLLCLAGTFSPVVYLFAVHHLGFGFSRIQLLCGAMVPGFVLSAYLVDAALRGTFPLTMGRAGWLLLPVAAEILVAVSVWRPLPLSGFSVAATLFLVLSLLPVISRRSSPGFVGLALLSAFLYGRPLILSRPRSAIHRSSALIEGLKQTTSGARFAIAGPGMKAVLPPNQEVLFDLRSINSYDSLSSHRYQELVGRWSVKGAETYGRYFKTIEPELALRDPSFRFTDVKVILSARTLPFPELTKIREINGIQFYRPLNVAVSLLQTKNYNAVSDTQVTIESLPAQVLPVQRVAQLDDFQRIKVSASTDETLLFLSQQYYQAWQATANQRPLRTVVVNRFYQGVIVPPMTHEVELTFRPLVLWSWVAQVFFVAAAALLFWGWFVQRKSVKTGDRG